MARKKQIHQQDNHDRWLISYADLVTLLLGFFIVMYALSTINLGKLKVFSESVELAFKHSNNSNKPLQIGEQYKYIEKIIVQKPNVGREPILILRQKKPKRISDNSNSSVISDGSQLNLIEKQLKDLFDKLIDENMVSVKQNQFGLEVEIKSKIAFLPSSAIPSDIIVTELKKLASILAKYKNSILVEGFTDNTPINTQDYLSNWELSSARASSIVKILSNSGVSPERLAAIGYGQYRPINDNSTELKRSKNRRVIIMISNNADIFPLRKVDSSLIYKEDAINDPEIKNKKNKVIIEKIQLPNGGVKYKRGYREADE